MKSNLKLVSFIFIMIAFVGLSAQDYQKDPLTLEGQGNMLTFRLVIGEKSAKLFLVGKEAVKLDFAQDTKLLEVTAFKSDAVKEELQFVPGQGYYTIPKLPDWALPYSIEVRAKVKGADETVKLKVKGKP